jgi:hypothetical protein
MPQAHASWVNLAATTQAARHGGRLEAMAEIMFPPLRHLTQHVTGMWGWEEPCPERHRPLTTLPGRRSCTSPRPSPSKTPLFLSTLLPCLSEAHSGVEAAAVAATVVVEAAVVAAHKLAAQADTPSGPRRRTFLT